MPGAPPNSSQHPTHGRRLARRFRGSVSATRCVAPPERTGRARVSSKTLASPQACNGTFEASTGTSL
jgi:hypothetical protein